MAERKLTHELVGAWVLKGNPETWDYFTALKDEGVRPGDVRPHDWTVARTYRAEMMAPGDLVVLWITGRNGPGIYEIGRITDVVHDVDGMDMTYAVDEAKARQTTLAVPFDSVVLKNRVPREDMKADPVLSGCEQFRIPQMSNPSYLTVDEVAALGAHLAGRVSKTAARPVGWQRHIR